MEVWRDVAGFEGRYQVRDQGRVRSLPRVVPSKSRWGCTGPRNMPGKVLAPGNCRGYLIVNVHTKGTIAVHLLVARTFLECNIPDAQVNHIDGVKTNNALSNLEWVTRTDNQLHAVATGLKTQAVRVKCPRTGRIFPSISQAAKASRVAHRDVAKWARP